MPFTVTDAKELVREGIAPSGLRAGSLAHAAHTFSPEGRVFLKGHCKGHGAVTRGSVTAAVRQLESADAFFTLWDCRAWD
jgi:hypothetical protein